MSPRPEHEPRPPSQLSISENASQSSAQAVKAASGSKAAASLDPVDGAVPTGGSQHSLQEDTTKSGYRAEDEDLLLDLREDNPVAPVSEESATRTEIGAETEMAERATEMAERAPENSQADAPQDLMSSSVATLKPTTSPSTTTATQYLTVESKTYIDPTPPTPTPQSPFARGLNVATGHSKHMSSSTEPSPTRSDAAYDEQRYISEDEQEGSTSRSEIQSIMEQFSEEGGGPGVEEVMSPRLEIASPMLGSPTQHPPRTSSLEPLAPSLAQQLQELQGLRLSASSPTSVRSKGKETDDAGPSVPPKDNNDLPYSGAAGHSREELPLGPDSPVAPSVTLHRPPPPDPEPEPALPFDFHRFLEQLRNKKADPVARYLKSFLSEFSKRQWMVHEQVKIISDFLAFIANKMAQCDVWRDVSDAEFDNAREGMEKLVMNRLYTQTFSPAIPPPQPIPGAKPKRRGGEMPMGPGRRGQHQEDVERDEVLAQKIKIYSWVQEKHLDIPPVSESGKRFLRLAQQELFKIRSYRAPRDKIICVLNCCKVIFGLLKHSKSDSSADSFMPMLIYVVLHANPEHLVSNVQYILRFRNQEKLGGEAGYYLSSLMGVIQFIENMDRTTLTITDEEFEANVEAAVSAIAEKHRLESPTLPTSHSARSASLRPQGTATAASAGAGEPSASASRPSLDIDGSNDGGDGGDGGDYSSGGEDKAPISGLLRSIQKPLSTIGRIFSDDVTPSASSSTPAPAAGSPGPSLLAGPARARTPQSEKRQSQQLQQLQQQQRQHGEGSREQRLSVEEAAARQASAEAAEAQRLHRAEHANVVETLAGMFPDLDRDVISDVVYQKEGRVGLAVDACLALSA